MAYRLTYSVNIDWVGAGQNVMAANLGPALPQGGRAGAQTLEIPNANVTGQPPAGGNASTKYAPQVVGTGTGGAIASADITFLTNAMATDIAAQMNLAPNLARMQGWASGQP
jgi:hypothetical protein